MKSRFLAVIATVITFLAAAILIVPLVASEGWELERPMLIRFGAAFLVFGALAGAAWYASGLGRKDDWPR